MKDVLKGGMISTPGDYVYHPSDMEKEWMDGARFGKICSTAAKQRDLVSWPLKHHWPWGHVDEFLGQILSSSNVYFGCLNLMIIDYSGCFSSR